MCEKERNVYLVITKKLEEKKKFGCIKNIKRKQKILETYLVIYFETKA